MIADLELALGDLAVAAPSGFARRVQAAVAGVDQFFRIEAADGDPLWVTFNPSGVNGVYFAPDEAAFRGAYAARWADAGRPVVPATAPPPRVAAVLEGRRPAHAVAYDLSGCSAFQQAVLGKTAEIPRGEVRSYAWIAREIGRRAGARAVGSALGRNPVPVLIPCHRVVHTDGRIGNYALGPAVKARLLAGEGVDVEELGRLAAAGARYVGSGTSKVFCVPTCRAARRTPARHRVGFGSAADAAAQGYRPCPECRPAGSTG